MNAFMRWKVRSLLLVGCGHFGNAASNSLLHRPVRLWGLGLRDIECETALDDVRNIAKCAGLPKSAGMPPNPLGRLLSDYLVAYLQSHESHLPGDWPFRLRELQICNNAQLPMVWLGSWKRVLLIELFDGADITCARLAANNCMSQFPAMLSSLASIGGRLSVIGVGKDRQICIYVKGEDGKEIRCSTILGVCRIAKHVLRHRRLLLQLGDTSSPVRRAFDGLPCIRAKSLQCPNGLRLLLHVALGPIANVQYRLHAGSYHFSDPVVPSSARLRNGPNSPQCNACGLSKPRLSLYTHVLGGPSDGQGYGCKATRSLILTRHNSTALKTANIFIRRRPQLYRVPGCDFELLADMSLATERRVGKSRRQADAIVSFTLEAFIIEASVCSNPIIAQRKVKQVKGGSPIQLVRTSADRNVSV